MTKMRIYIFCFKQKKKIISFFCVKRQAKLGFPKGVEKKVLCFRLLEKDIVCLALYTEKVNLLTFVMI